MSMLSSMTEKMRIMARLVRDYDHREISRSLRDAADTIDNLRGMCQDVQFENEKLREVVTLMDKRDVLLPCGRGCDADCRFHGSHCERIGTLMGELGFKVES